MLAKATYMLKGVLSHSQFQHVHNPAVYCALQPHLTSRQCFRCVGVGCSTLCQVLVTTCTRPARESPGVVYPDSESECTVLSFRCHFLFCSHSSSQHTSSCCSPRTMSREDSRSRLVTKALKMFAFACTQSLSCAGIVHHSSEASNYASYGVASTYFEVHAVHYLFLGIHGCL